MPRDVQLQERTCTGPGCDRPAVMQCKGTDFDGSEFTETVCEGCGSYLIESAAEIGYPLRHWRLA